MKAIICLAFYIVVAQAGYLGPVGHVPQHVAATYIAQPVVSTYAVPSYHTVPAVVYGGLGYSGLGYSGLGYNGLGYSGLGYSGLGYNHGIVGHDHGHGHVKYILGKKK